MPTDLKYLPVHCLITYQGNKATIEDVQTDSLSETLSNSKNKVDKISGVRVIGDRKIINYYPFSGDLDNATVYATVRVSPAGTGTFLGFGKNSTTRAQAYANKIIHYLKNIQFDKWNDERIVTVRFNFNNH